MKRTINLQLPKTIKIGGTVLPKEGTITFDKEPNGKIDSAIVRINIESNITVVICFQNCNLAPKETAW